MPPRPESKESLRPYHSQIEGAIKNALSVALGGDIDPKDLVLDKRDLQKIEEDIAADGEEAAGVNKKPNTRTSREKTISRFGQRQNAESAGGGISDLNSQADAGSGIPAEMRSDGAGPNANSLEDDENEEDDEDSSTDNEDGEADDGSEEGKKPETEPEPPSPAEARQAAEKKEMDDFLEKTDASFKRCPYDGQILNQDGSCPAGDHNSLGAQPKQPGQTGAAGQPNQPGGPATPGRPGNQQQPNQPAQGNQAQNPQAQAPQTMRQMLYADQNAKDAAKKQIDDLKGQITKDKAEIVKLKKKKDALDSKIQKLNALATLTNITVVLFMIGFALHAYAWYLSSDRGKIEKQIKKIETGIKNKQKKIAKIAKQNKIKA